MRWTSLSFDYIRTLIGVLLTSLLLIGCATVKPAPATDAANAENIESRPYHENITIGGRLSVSYQQYGRDEAIHGSFHWAQRAERMIVTLLSPLGQTIAIIEVTPTLSILTQAGQAPRTAANVDALAAEALGWPLPVSGLRYWLQGFAADTEGQRLLAFASTDTVGAASRDGWRIQYPNWQEDDGKIRPRRIDLQRIGTEAGDVAIRIVIDEWHPA